MTFERLAYGKQRRRRKQLPMVKRQGMIRVQDVENNKVIKGPTARCLAITPGRTEVSAESRLLIFDPSMEKGGINTILFPYLNIHFAAKSNGFSKIPAVHEMVADCSDERNVRSVK